MSTKVVDPKAGLRTSEQQVKARALESGMVVWGQGTVISAKLRGSRVDVNFGVVTHAYEPDEPVLLDG